MRDSATGLERLTAIIRATAIAVDLPPGDRRHYRGVRAAWGGPLPISRRAVACLIAATREDAPKAAS